MGRKANVPAKNIPVKVPQITSLETAIELYYTRTELSTKDIEMLFGKTYKDKMTRLKRAAREKMAEKGVRVWNARYINTAAAYEAWGLDIEDLERRHRKLQEFKSGC